MVNSQQPNKAKTTKKPPANTNAATVAISTRTTRRNAQHVPNLIINPQPLAAGHPNKSAAYTKVPPAGNII
jgi:hypothetical protein